MSDDTTLDYYYSQQDMTLTEALAIVIGKKANNMLPSTAKEEVAEDFLMKWADLFGYETAK